VGDDAAAAIGARDARDRSRPAAAKLDAPAVTIIGDVVDLERRLRWFEKKPLFGQKIVVTASREQSSELARKFEALGAEVAVFSTIRIRPVRVKPIRIRGYTHVAFTSRTAVEYFFPNLAGDTRSLAGRRSARSGTRPRGRSSTAGSSPTWSRGSSPAARSPGARAAGT
jgi:uroporphyrinogen III methyltransferase/synthase